MKSDLWEVKFKMLKKTWDYQHSKLRDCQPSLLTTETSLVRQLNKLTPTNNASRNWQVRMQLWATKWEQLNRTLDFQLAHLANYKESSRLSVVN
jgi:hypothetical protein